MIIVMKRNASANEVKEVMAHIKEVGLNPVIIEGTERDVIGVTGDTATVDIRTIRANKNIAKYYAFRSRTNWQTVPSILKIHKLKSIMKSSAANN